MWSQNIVATPLVVRSVETGNRQIIFENQSTTVRITFFPWDLGRGPMILTEMIFHGACRRRSSLYLALE